MIRRPSTRSSTDYRVFAESIGIEKLHRHPALGLQGRQYHRRVRADAPWYRRAGSLIEHLETVPLDADTDAQDAVPPAGAVGQPPPISISAALPA